MGQIVCISEICDSSSSTVVSQTGWLGLKGNCWFLLYLFGLWENKKSCFGAKLNHCILLKDLQKILINLKLCYWPMLQTPKHLLLLVPSYLNTSRKMRGQKNIKNILSSLLSNFFTLLHGRLKDKDNFLSP